LVGNGSHVRSHDGRHLIPRYLIRAGESFASRPVEARARNEVRRRLFRRRTPPRASRKTSPVRPTLEYSARWWAGSSTSEAGRATVRRLAAFLGALTMRPWLRFSEYERRTETVRASGSVSRCSRAVGSPNRSARRLLG
jgi:hypothetical protein